MVVRPEGPGYVLIAGERRWRAAQEAGLTELPALIRETDEVGTVTEALVENLLREDLNPLEEAAAFHQLEDEFGMTHAEIGEKVGRSRPPSPTPFAFSSSLRRSRPWLPLVLCQRDTPGLCLDSRIRPWPNTWPTERLPRDGRSGNSRRRCGSARE